MKHVAPYSVLIAEDEGLVSMMLEDVVRDLGAGVVHVFSAVADAVEAAVAAPYDFAVVDVILRDGNSTPLADVLEERGIPFLFSTGVGLDAIEPRHRTRRFVPKPFEEEDLKRHIRDLLAPA